MFTLAADYFLLVFVAGLGVIQIAASLNGLNGLLIFKSPLVARALGLALAVAAFILFFSTEERNLNDYEGGIDANIQALLFFLGVVASGWVTFIGSSLMNMRMKGKDPLPGGGFDALRETNYVRALALSLGYWSKNWRQQMKSYFSG